MTIPAVTATATKTISKVEKVRGYVLTFETTQGMVGLSFTQDHHAEQVLRGLVHSGYVVTISEQLVDIPESLKAIKDWEHNRYIGNGEFDISEPQAPQAPGMIFRA